MFLSDLILQIFQVDAYIHSFTSTIYTFKCQITLFLQYFILFYEVVETFTRAYAS